MSFLQDIEKITEERFLIILLDSIFLFSPGLLTIFYFWNNIFLESESVKLILLSLAISSPFVLWNFLLLFAVVYKGKLSDFNEKDLTFALFTATLVLTNILFYLLLLASYIIEISFQSSLYLLIGIELVLFIIVLVLNKKIAKKIGKSDQQPIDYIPAR